LGGPAAGKAGPPGIDQIRSRLRQQQDKITSLYVRVRQTTTVSAAPERLGGWAGPMALPDSPSTEEVICFAFKGANRYLRAARLDLKALPPGGLDVSVPAVIRADQTRGYDGRTLRQRTFAPRPEDRDARNPVLAFLAFLRSYEYRTLPLAEGGGGLAAPEYLGNVGLAVPDPTCQDEAHRNLEQMGMLVAWLQRWPYRVLETTREIDGARCVVLEGNMECPLPAKGGAAKTAIEDRLWLDADRGLALRKRETKTGGHLLRVVNSEFEEALPGVWFPKRSLTQVVSLPEAGEASGGRPLLNRQITLCYHRPNQVIDGLFDLVLTEANPPLDRQCEEQSKGTAARGFAYRMRQRRLLPRQEPFPEPAPDDRNSEVWLVPDVGRREEVRQGSQQMALITVDTPRWQLEWDAVLNRVVASPSQLKRKQDRSLSRLELSRPRETLIRLEELLGTPLASRKERIDGRELERIEGYAAEVTFEGDGPRRDRLPAPLEQLLATEFRRARTWWVDPGTQLVVGRRCGCKGPAQEILYDFRPPDTFPRELFTLKIPRDALLIVDDPQLGRRILSPGETKP
jgi:hypothetical protein